MKALELNVYPRLDGMGYIVPLRVWSPAAAVHPEDDFTVFLSENDVQQRSESQRLTDAELAAEFWHAAQVATYARGRIDWGLPGHGAIDADRAEDIEHILNRFAELPHYDEADQ